MSEEGKKRIAAFSARRIVASPDAASSYLEHWISR